MTRVFHRGSHAEPPALEAMTLPLGYPGDDFASMILAYILMLYTGHLQLITHEPQKSLH